MIELNALIPRYYGPPFNGYRNQRTKSGTADTVCKFCVRTDGFVAILDRSRCYAGRHFLYTSATPCIDNCFTAYPFLIYQFEKVVLYSSFFYNRVGERVKKVEGGFNSSTKA